MAVLLASLWPITAAAAFFALFILALRPPVPPVVLRGVAFVGVGLAALSVQGAATASGINLWVVAASVALLSGAASAAIFTPGTTTSERVWRGIGSVLMGGIVSSGVITKYAMPHTEWIWVCGAGGFFGWAIGAFLGFLAVKLSKSKSIEAAKAIFLPAPKE